MRYMLMICADEDDLRGPDGELPTNEAIWADPEVKAWLADTDGRDVRRGGARLRPVSDATTVRVRNGEVLLSDGPFAESKEQVGGFDLIEVANLDEAIELAARHPNAKVGSVEIRPIWE